MAPRLDSDVDQPAAAGKAGLGAAGAGGFDEVMKMLNEVMGSGGLGDMFAGKDPSKMSPEEIQEAMQNVDMSKMARLYQSFIWKMVRSPVVAQYLENDEAMEMLRQRLQQSLDQVLARNDDMTAQLKPLLNDEIKSMVNDPVKFREELHKLVDLFMNMPDPMAGEGPDMDFSAFGGMPKADDDDLDDLDNLPDNKEL
jgi:hypothetical protein